MPLSSLQIADYWHRHPDNQVILDMLVESIAPRDRQAYYVVAGNPNATTDIIAKHLKTYVPSVGNMLLRLLGYGLVEREVHTNESGLYYTWAAPAPPRTRCGKESKMNILRLDRRYSKRIRNIIKSKRLHLGKFTDSAVLYSWTPGYLRRDDRFVRRLLALGMVTEQR